MKKNFILIVISLVQCLAIAQEPSAQSEIIKIDTMNGYKLKDFENFEKNWNLVTVRFRRDTGEMRFTYANPLAFEHLKKGSTDYPNGAIFAKIGFKTDEDTRFPSSAVPSDARRYQFMVREKSQFKETNGWGYMLFDQQGYLAPEKPNVQQAACAACHRIVSDKGYVFSDYLEFSPFKNKNATKSKKHHYSQKIIFKDLNISELPESIRARLPLHTQMVRMLVHEITEFLFQGTLDEIKPVLAAEAIRSQKPVLFLSKDKKSFALAFIENVNSKCDLEGRTGYFVKAISSSLKFKDRVYENRFCWPE